MKKHKRFLPLTVLFAVLPIITVLWFTAAEERIHTKHLISYDGTMVMDVTFAGTVRDFGIFRAVNGELQCSGTLPDTILPHLAEYAVQMEDHTVTLSIPWSLWYSVKESDFSSHLSRWQWGDVQMTLSTSPYGIEENTNHSIELRFIHEDNTVTFSNAVLD